MQLLLQVNLSKFVGVPGIISRYVDMTRATSPPSSATIFGRCQAQRFSGPYSLLQSPAPLFISDVPLLPEGLLNGEDRETHHDESVTPYFD